MDFNAGSIMINEPFQNYIERDEFDNEFSKRKSYIYVISKVFDGTRYYKVGMSTKSDIGRMGDANTYLIPGKENKAYQVHYLFFYDESPYKNSFAHYIEKEIHAVLRHEFDSYNIRFLTNNPSEWYLPQKTNSSNNRRRTRRSQSGEDWFFGYVLGLVSVNQPKPRECYQFTKADRKDITKQVQNPSKQILRQYNQHKKDFRDVLKIIKIEKKMNKKERDEKLGNQSYWQDKLIGLEFIDKDDKTKRKKTWVIDKGHTCQACLGSTDSKVHHAQHHDKELVNEFYHHCFLQALQSWHALLSRVRFFSRNLRHLSHLGSSPWWVFP